MYPKKWYELDAVPEARFELISYIDEIVHWNDEGSDVKRDGADHILDFLFDVHNMDTDSRHLVGKLIFQEELFVLNSFVQSFDKFIELARQDDPELDHIHDRTLPAHVEESAKRLYVLLAQSGLPKQD